jgi:hypothetical protein
LDWTNYPFSFESVCDALNIDSDMLRQRLGGLARGLRTADRLGVGRLRLKESSRALQMTANRVRPRRGRPSRSGVSLIDQESA